MKRLMTIVMLTTLVACKGRQESTPVAGNTTRGSQLITQYGCNSCHVIPGIEGANGMVGPSLEHVALRQIIAGKLKNTPQTMAQYIENPQMADPQNAMPNLAVKPDEARDIAAYLYTLH